MQSNERKVRVVIPARYGSQRLPGKPLVDLAGKPMIVRVFDAVKAGFDAIEVTVAVDDRRILDALAAHDICGVMSDPECPSGTDRVAEVARNSGWSGDDLIVNVQGDEPLLPPQLLRTFVDFCTNRPGMEMATISAPIGNFQDISDPNVVKVTVREDGTALTFSRSPVPFDRDRSPDGWQPTNYRRHLGVYAYRNDVLQRLTTAPPCYLESLERLEQLRALWMNITIDVMCWDEIPPGGVDTAEDAARVADYFRTVL